MIMSHWLYLSPPADADAEWSLTWWQADAPAQHGTLAQAAAQLRGQPLSLLLPMEMASYHQVSVPARSGRWLRQALQSALEDQVVDDLDDLHLAHGPLRDKQHCALFAIDRERLRQCLAALAAQDLHPVRVHIDADCLPADQPCALGWDQRWLIGGAAPLRLALSDAELPALAPLLPGPLHWFGAQAPSGIDSAQWHAQDTPWARLSRGSASAIDLCQGAFARPGKRRWPWRTLAVVLIIGCAAQLVQTVGHRLLIEQRSAQLKQQNLALWQQRFPDDGPVIDLPRQLQAKLRQQGQGQAGMTRQLSQLAEQWAASSGALAVVHRLNYQQGEGWSLQVSAPDFADLQQLRERLVAQGLSVSAEASVRDSHGVSTRLKIKEQAL